jgi:hypothetical protein
MKVEPTEVGRTKVERTEIELLSDKPRSSDGSVLACNATTAMVLQHCNNDGVVTRNTAIVTALLLLLLELGAMALLQLWLRRCWSSQQWRCCSSGCGAAGARSDGAVATLAAALLELAVMVLLQLRLRRCWSSQRRYSALLELAAMALLQLWLRQY